MLIDAHLHCTGRERVADVLQSLDDAAIDRGVLLAPFLSEGYSLDDAASLRRANEHLAALVRGHGDRLTGFAVVDPRDPDAARDLRHAVETLGLSGVKMVPTGWYPYDDRVKPVFEVASELRLPVLFHSGIFIDGRSGRFCRPAFFEALRDHPGARIALAHLGWPWTDEAIAVGVIDLINGVPPDRAAFRFDISFGPPPAYRLEVLRRALDVLGPGLLQFASDCFLPCPGREIAERHGWVVELMDQLGLPPDVRERISSGTASAWLGLAGSGSSPDGRHHPVAADGCRDTRPAGVLRTLVARHAASRRPDRGAGAGVADAAQPAAADRAGRRLLRRPGRAGSFRPLAARPGPPAAWRPNRLPRAWSAPACVWPPPSRTAVETTAPRRSRRPR